MKRCITCNRNLHYMCFYSKRTSNPHIHLECKACKREKRKRQKSISNREYTKRSWYAMRGRCHSKSSGNYQYYGGNGVEIDSRWDDFDNFLKDMGERPDNHVLDRIDAEQGYGPGNCRWITQAHNIRRKRCVKMSNGKRRLAKWYYGFAGMSHSWIAQELGVSRKTISFLLNWQTWSEEGEARREVYARDVR